MLPLYTIHMAEQASSSIIFSLKHVSKSFHGKTVLDTLSLDIPAGETVVLLGPSGCGKSTILRLLLGLTAPTTGDVLFNGRVLAGDDIRMMRRKMGYVIQKGGLFPHMTAAQNISLMARSLHWPADKIADRLTVLADLTAFPKDALTRFPAQLSGGQQQRVALMRALMLDPDVLLMDEPLGALDSIVRHQLQRDLKQIFDRLHKTVVMVTHDIAEAGYFSDRIYLLRDGGVAQAGSLADLVHHPANDFVAEYIAAQRGILDVLEDQA